MSRKVSSRIGKNGKERIGGSFKKVESFKEKKLKVSRKKSFKERKLKVSRESFKDCLLKQKQYTVHVDISTSIAASQNELSSSS